MLLTLKKFYGMLPYLSRTCSLFLSLVLLLLNSWLGVGRGWPRNSHGWCKWCAKYFGHSVKNIQLVVGEICHCVDTIHSTLWHTRPSHSEVSLILTPHIAYHSTQVTELASVVRCRPVSWVEYDGDCSPAGDQVTPWLWWIVEDVKSRDTHPHHPPLATLALGKSISPNIPTLLNKTFSHNTSFRSLFAITNWLSRTIFKTLPFLRYWLLTS